MPETDTSAPTPPIPPTSPTTPAPPLTTQIVDHSHLFRLLVTITVVLLISSLAFGIYQRGKNQSVPPTAKPLTISPTADWKTYTDSLHGFEFKYPTAEYTLQKNLSNVRLATKTAYIFEVAWINTDKSIEEWWAGESKNRIPHLMTKAEFHGLPAYYFRLNTKWVQIPMDMYAIKTGEEILTISYEVPFNLNLYDEGDERETYRSANSEFGGTGKTIDQILATFKFLD